MRSIQAAIATCIALAACASTAPAPLARGETARQQVVATERAFAKSMADRDLNAFGSFLSQDTVFFSGPKPLHGKQAVIDFWSRFYAKQDAPFSWEPKVVEVMDTGELALSSGPVYDPQGKLFACFSSIWRQENPGQWKIVFDRGSGAQECDKQ
ncbi:MAG TPA: nuclear transport factor 2 family protein [Ramlibacter sp.]|nr:nuclear transport factor 2 family protein [Ramlibacter sp.]